MAALRLAVAGAARSTIGGGPAATTGASAGLPDFGSLLDGTSDGSTASDTGFRQSDDAKSASPPQDITTADDAAPAAPLDIAALAQAVLLAGQPHAAPTPTAPAGSTDPGQAGSSEAGDATALAPVPPPTSGAPPSPASGLFTGASSAATSGTALKTAAGDPSSAPLPLPLQDSSAAPVSSATVPGAGTPTSGGATSRAGAPSLPPDGRDSDDDAAPDATAGNSSSPGGTPSAAGPGVPQNLAAAATATLEASGPLARPVTLAPVPRPGRLTASAPVETGAATSASRQTGSATAQAAGSATRSTRSDDEAESIEPAANQPPPTPGADALLALQTAAGAATASASQQVATALSSLASPSASAETGGAAGAAAPVATGPGTVRATADGGREIVIKLDPEHLGSVAIRLRMTGDAVDVSITVSNPGTLGTLDRDRHMLTAALASAGLSGDALTLKPGMADPASGASPAMQAAGQDASGQAKSGFAAGSGDPSGSGGRRRDGSATASSSASLPAEIGEPDPSRSGGLYV